MTLEFLPVDLAQQKQIDFLTHMRNDTNAINGFDPKEPEKLVEEVKKHQAIKPEYASIGYVKGEPVAYMLLGESGFIDGAGHVWLLGVKQDSRRTGLGREALLHIENAFRAEGRTMATLATIAANDVSTKFYENCKWECFGPEPEKPHVLMWKKELKL